MRTFIVKVRTEAGAFTYPALATCSADLIVAAFESFNDALCIVVTARGEK